MPIEQQFPDKVLNNTNYTKCRATDSLLTPALLTSPTRHLFSMAVMQSGAFLL